MSNRSLKKSRKKQIKGSGKCFSKTCNNEDRITGAESLNDTESLILISFKIGDDKLNGYILPSSDGEKIRSMVDRILENDEKVYILATNFDSKEKMLESIQNNQKKALEKRREIENQYSFSNDITMQTFYRLKLHKQISDDDYQKHRIDTLFLPILIQHLNNDNITIQNVANLESQLNYTSEGYYDKKKPNDNLPKAYATSVPTERPRLQAIGERRPTIYDDMVASRVPMGGKTNKKRKSLKKNKSYKKK